MRTVLTTVCLSCLFAFSPPVLAQSNSNGGTNIATAPAAVTSAATLRSTLAHAKTAFLVAEVPSGDAADVRLRELRATLAHWGRFDIVDRSDRADVTIAFGDREIKEVAVASGVPIGAVLVNPETATVRRHVVTLTVRQRSTGEILWKGEGRTIESVLQRLQQDTSRGPAVCIPFWCS